MTAAGHCLLLPHPAKPEVGTIFRDLGKEFLEREWLTPDQRRAFRRIAECGTAALGGSVWHCDACDHWVGVFHSCRDRHCPRCQAGKRAAWVADRVGELLAVPYFHVVFTLPHALHPLIRANPAPTLGLLMRCASKTLMTFAADPQWLGAEPGILMVLHTWDRKLGYHVHVHCLITGGGLSTDRSRWVSPPKGGFIFPEGALAKVFRGKYLEGLDELRAAGLREPARLGITTDVDWAAYKRKVAGTRWVSHVQALSGGPEHVVKYLARYINRVGFSNQRLLSYRNGRVRFSYKDSRDGRDRVLDLDVADFAHRYLLHILPRGFSRIRYAGLLANRKKTKSLLMCKLLLHDTMSRPKPAQLEAWLSELEARASTEGAECDPREPEVRKCPRCQQYELRYDHKLPRFVRKTARALLWDTS